MDGFYSGIETSLLALTLALGLAVALTSSLQPVGMMATITTTLPMISVSADTPAE